MKAPKGHVKEKGGKSKDKGSASGIGLRRGKAASGGARRALLSSPAEKQAAKRQQAINAALTVTLEAKQTIEMASNVGIRTLTVAAWDALKKKIDAKLVPTLLDMCQAHVGDSDSELFGDDVKQKKDEQATDTDHVLEDLTQCQQAMQTLRPMIIAWNAVRGL